MKCPYHHFRLNGHCPYCGESLSKSRPVMNPPADKAEAGNRVYAAPLQANPLAQRRGIDRRVLWAGGLARNRHQPSFTNQGETKP